MKINKVKKLKNGKYEIITDFINIITYDDIIIKYNLLYKKNIDNKLLKNISDDTKFYDIYDDTVKYATKKVRCEKEIIDYLNKYEIDTNNKDIIIKKLKDTHVLNDRVYARSYINDKLLFSKLSMNRIKEGLISNNILIDIVLDEIEKVEDYDEVSRLNNIVKKRINSNHKYSNYILKNKIINEMISLGYIYDDIIIALDSLMNTNDEYNKLIKEYNKLYFKYRKKYSEYELERIIKNKLYTKGFKYDDIKKEDLI